MTCTQASEARKGDSALLGTRLLGLGLFYLWLCWFSESSFWVILRRSRFSPRSLTTPPKKCFNTNTPANTSFFPKLICLIQNSQIPKGTGGFYLHSAVIEVPNMGNHTNQPLKGLRSGNLPWDASLLNPLGSYLYLYHLHTCALWGLSLAFFCSGPYRAPGTAWQQNLTAALPPLSCSGFLPRDGASRQLKAERGKSAHRQLHLQLRISFSKSKQQHTGLMLLFFNSCDAFALVYEVFIWAYVVIFTAGFSSCTATIIFIPNWHF